MESTATGFYRLKVEFRYSYGFKRHIFNDGAYGAGCCGFAASSRKTIEQLRAQDIVGGNADNLAAIFEWESSITNCNTLLDSMALTRTSGVEDFAATFGYQFILPDNIRQFCPPVGGSLSFPPATPSFEITDSFSITGVNWNLTI